MKNNKSIIDKLTALWALNESGLGGFLHVLKSPFTGLLVGGIAILLISLIAYYAENKWRAILKALIIVLIIKVAVSPHSPPTAYLAVTFQAVFGAFLLSNFSWKGITLSLLGMITFLQSALQKLIVLTIIYGENLWEAINLYGAWLMEKTGFVSGASTTSLLIFGYLLLYGIAGILAGLFIKSIIKLISKQASNTAFVLHFNKTSSSKQKKKGLPFRSRVLLVWGITIVIILLAFTFSGGPSSGLQKGLYIMLRSLLVLMLWYVIIGPFILKLIRKYLMKKESEYKEDISNAMDLFPYFRSIISHTWKTTRHLKGYTRFKYFIAHTILYCIHFEINPE